MLKRGRDKMTKWDDFKKELHVPKKELELAQAKLMLSELIHDLRRSKKMSQKELAHAIGASQPYIAKIEDGEENLTIETIVKLLSVFKVRLGIRAEKKEGSETVFHILKAA